MKYLFLLVTISVLSFECIAQKNEWNNNQVIAHRGAWKKNNLPENSVAALKEAIRLKCFGAEFDVHMTADEVLVVNHDPDYLGIRIETSTYKQLKSKKLPNGEQIPTLEKYLKEGMKQHGTKLILEIKPSIVSQARTIALATKVVEMVKKVKAQEWVEYISFNYDALKQVLLLQPDAKVYYLNGEASPEKLKQDGFAGADYHFSVFQKNDWLKKLNELGLVINAWTVNKTEDMQWLLAHKADFITTNEPELLFEIIKDTPTANGWVLKWADEFNANGLPDNKKWTYDIGGDGWGNNELQYYTSADTNNAVVKNGTLNIIAQKESYENSQYTSARLLTKNKFDFKYGRVEARIKLPKGKGLWPAFWMLPTDWKYGGWPKSGEIDIMEHVGYEPDSVHGSIHTEKFNHIKNTQVTKGVNIANSYTDFHVYAVEWTTDTIDFIIDGQKYLSFPNSKVSSGEWPFDQNFHVILNTAVGGNWGGKYGVDQEMFPATMQVDYVRVYSKE